VLVVGIDIVELKRFAQVVERWGARFLQRIYTANELAYCKRRIPQLAARFAAKEAVMKALGTGIRGVGWKEIEIQRQRGKGPTITLHGRAKLKAESIMMEELAISISHSRDSAVVSVVGRRDETSNN
jgi:holo-[acyl-carrier protein] synthase